MQAKQLWQAVLGDLQVRLSRNAFDNWLRPTTIVGFQDDVATVAAANTFGASTLQGRYAADIERVMSDIVGRPIRVEFTVLRGEERARADDPVEGVENDEEQLPPRGQAAVASPHPLPGGFRRRGGRPRHGDCRMHPAGRIQQPRRLWRVAQPRRRNSWRWRRRRYMG